ncbi:uracil-DNA glycosylase family protein [Dokdonella immobilis]|uniref:Hypoxanthine-DNA glycosylase n=1 Tax=Dokdonella immobilis TaxID=578942 RepID=A0A1I4Y927_9GAMM|nr:uracil-DNA glycosylase family protein [Dokdonella immobilis]SFN34119.1 hypoxanthine-DNA glycosylase [Dokdonella immobilis]
MNYAERIARLHARGVGIWDVLAHCERAGSLDSNIVRASEVANDIPGLLAAHASIVAIALNGGRARQSFRRLVLPALEARIARPLSVLELPSTSPANAGMTRAQKRAHWRALLDWSS